MAGGPNPGTSIAPPERAPMIRRRLRRSLSDTSIIDVESSPEDSPKDCGVSTALPKEENWVVDDERADDYDDLHFHDDHDTYLHFEPDPDFRPRHSPSLHLLDPERQENEANPSRTTTLSLPTKTHGNNNAPSRAFSSSSPAQASPKRSRTARSPSPVVNRSKSPSSKRKTKDTKGKTAARTRKVTSPGAKQRSKRTVSGQGGVDAEEDALLDIIRTFVLSDEDIHSRVLRYEVWRCLLIRK